jgi:hypothetical protein
VLPFLRQSIGSGAGSRMGTATVYSGSELNARDAIQPFVSTIENVSILLQLNE